MADQKNRGGQKKGNQQLEQRQQKQDRTTQNAGGRSQPGKRQDQLDNPDDSVRKPTNKQR